jgi:hypothetical protein
MTNSYKDRIFPGAFKDDVECEVRLQPDPRDEATPGTSAWIPERLLSRLRYLGLAYELQLLARLPENGQVRYPEIQLPSLEDELAFLFQVVSDNALLETGLVLRDLIGRAMQDPRGWSLVVETN